LSSASHELLEIDGPAGVDFRRLQLRKQAGLALHERDRFVERRDTFTFELAVEPRAGVETFDLFEREVVCEPRFHRLAFPRHHRRAIGKQLFNVCRAIQRRVVKADQNAVFRDSQILFDVIGMHLQREAV